MLSFCCLVKAQNLIERNENCDFLKNLTFKNGRDTIVIKATYEEFIEGSPDPFLDDLGKNHQLKYNEFGVLPPKKGEEMGDSGSNMGLIPENCSELYYAVLSRKISYKGFPQKMGTPVYITCVVFNNPKYVYRGLPYFVIINVKVRKLTAAEKAIEKADSCTTLFEESANFTPAENGKKYLACKYITGEYPVYKVKRLYETKEMKFTQADTTDSTMYYIKDADKYQPITDDNFDFFSEIIISDDLELASKIKNKELKYRDLDKIIKAYKKWKMTNGLPQKALK